MLETIVIATLIVGFLGLIISGIGGFYYINEFQIIGSVMVFMSFLSFFCMLIYGIFNKFNINCINWGNIGGISLCLIIIGFFVLLKKYF